MAAFIDGVWTEAEIKFHVISLVGVCITALLLFKAQLQPDFMDNAQWRNRVLIECTQLESENHFVSNLGTLIEGTDLAGLSERNLKYIVALPNASFEYHNRTRSGHFKFEDIDRNGKDMFQDYGCVPGQVILIGKDGGIKKRWDSMPSSEEIFAIIDAMPMRQQEMQQPEYERR